MKLIVTLERRRNRHDCGRMSGHSRLRFSGEDGRRSDGQHPRGHPSMRRGPRRQRHAADGPSIEETPEPLSLPPYEKY